MKGRKAVPSSERNAFDEADGSDTVLERWKEEGALSPGEEEFIFRANTAGSAAEPGDLIAVCASWLDVDGQLEKLSLRWARLEDDAMRRKAGVQSLQAPQDVDVDSERPPAVRKTEMDAIDLERTKLEGERERLSRSLMAIPARTLHDIAAKLAVAARILDGEGGEAYLLVAESLALMERLRSDDGEPISPASCRYVERV